MIASKTWGMGMQVDEIQMLGDPLGGAAWTRALLIYSNVLIRLKLENQPWWACRWMRSRCWGIP